MEKRKPRKIDRMLEMPKEVYTNLPKITITGFDEIIIENFKGILEYETYYVKIKTYIGIVTLSGNNFNLENLTNDNIKVTGKIESIEFERLVD